MDKKVSADSFKVYRNWQRYILKTHPKLTHGRIRPTLILYCLVMASHGTNGIGCYASNEKIAKEVGMYDGRSVKPYRDEALRLGWFVLTGESRGRVQVMDIAIPADGVAVAEHDTSTTMTLCAACRPLLAKVYSGQMTTGELGEAHFGHPVG